MSLKSYRELEVWQKAMDLVEATYRLTATLPAKELFGLASQAQRAAVSIPANIAEGYGRDHRKEYLRHLSFARGSLMELETHLTIAVRLGFLTREQTLPTWGLTQQVGRLLSGLTTALKRAPKPQTPNP